MKKLLIAILLVGLTVTGCGKVPVLSDGKEAVLTSKDWNISVDELYEKIKDTYALQTLVDMIDAKILEEDYPTSDEEKEYIQSTKDDIKQSFENSYYVNYYSSFEQFLLAYYGVSDISAVNEQISLTFKRQQAIKDYAKSIVTDKEIQNYYDNTVIGNIKASHILITPEYDDDASESEIKEAKEKALKTAKSIIEKLNNGEDFETLAKKYSADSSSQDGGNVGWFNRDEMVEQFEEAAIKLKVGEYTKTPVETKYGYHIILKTDSKEKPELSKVKDTIIETLADEKLEKDTTLQTKALVSLREKAEIKIEDDELARQYKNYINNLLNS